MAPFITYTKPSDSKAGASLLSDFEQSYYAPAIQTTLAADAKYEYFVREDNTACITRCVSSSKSIDIPACIDGCEVVELAADSFANLFSAESIACPCCVQRIGDRAFSGCRTLRELRLNEGLQHIGAHACANCVRLNAITLPSSVRTIGCNIAGCTGDKWCGFGRANVVVDPDNQHLFIDENLVVYAREEQGLALVDASSFLGGKLHVLPGTYRICDFACASHGKITSVVLPEGLQELGEACFSGCYNLTEVNFPSTLVSWGDNAFSSTRLTHVDIPAGCVRICERSFNFGPAADKAYGWKYTGSIERITVDERHPFLTMMGALLCARVASDEVYQGLLCESNVRELTIPPCVKSLSKAALSGLTKCSVLRVHEDLQIDNDAGLLPHGKLERLIIDLKAPIKGNTQVDLEIPEGVLGEVMGEGRLTSPSIDVRAFLQAYDMTVASEGDDLARARHYTARLASGVYLAPATEEAARAWLSQNISSVCIHFGLRNYWDGFSQLVDCGLLDKAAIDEAVAVLSGYNDAAALAYLLQLKHTRFSQASWDYDL